ncbi:MAG TPA: primosomal protein N', partial [Burkholderiales bacterium]
PELPTPLPGCRVRVSFGRRRSLIGVVVELRDDSEVPSAQLKPVLRVLDDAPLLPASLLSLLRWAAEYYHHPIGEVIATALPTRLRRLDLPDSITVSVWTTTPAGAAADPECLKRSPAQRRLLEALKEAPSGLEAPALQALSGRWRQALAALEARGWVSVHQRNLTTDGPSSASEKAPVLTEAQQRAVQAITGARGFAPFLLHGVTGSGKTEVYLQAIAEILARGEQALLLVPEIGLTPQLVARLRARFSAPLVVLHSDLNDIERARAWLLAAAGQARLVVGTRSAVFTPLPRLRLIVVDEEHDPSYKQQDGFRYSARDVAVMRASRERIPIVLGSATPSLESYHRAASGAYTRLVLPARAGGAALPEIELLDMRRLTAVDGLSHPLRDALARTLERGEQALLFLNRRGFAPVWMCFGCGWVAPCTRCDARLTLHRGSGRLRCHHCGSERPIPEACPVCRGTQLRALGAGTERVESALARLYPHARLLRIDRDSTRAKGALEAKLARARDGAADILIGTQMLSKGHDFPNVTLVGVLNADQGLYGTDFRAAERLVQQIIQVSGRAGRATKAGRVLIQTYHPDHPVFTALCRQDYDEFAAYALAERREADYPPYTHLALLRAESPHAGAALAFLRAARRVALACNPEPEVRVMEPVPSPMERRAGRYRAQLLVQASKRAPLHALLGPWLDRLTELKAARRVRWSLDVDPADLY